MSKKKPSLSNTPNEILALRKQIDALDDKIIALLITRISIVKKVGKIKHRLFPGVCAIRPGREADMVRDVANKFKGSGFSSAAAAAIWRLLIGASTSAERPLTISAYVEPSNNDFYWMAREYFGPFLPVAKQSNIRYVIGDVMDRKASVGIVPLPHGSDAHDWWIYLIGDKPNMPKIFAHIPFAHYEPTAKHTPLALAIAAIAPEPTENDSSYLVLETRDTVSQHKLQHTLAQEGLKASWIKITPHEGNRRYHLVQCEGFVTATDEKITATLASIGTSMIKVHFLGAYAKPISLI